jgi:hypothetical protein
MCIHMTQMTKVPGYVRVSTNKQDLSFEAQQERLKAMAVVKGLTCSPMDRADGVENDGAAISLAEGLRRTAHWFHSPRMSGSHHYLRGALSASCSRVVSFLLPQLAHSSVARQRRSAIPTNTASPLKVGSSKFVKSVDCTIITNAGPPNSIDHASTGPNLSGGST